MFVAVACTACGKPFQVPQDGLGKPAVCPWCRADVLALPVGLPADPAPPAAPEPLSLDDAPAPARHFPRARVAAAAVALAVAAAVTLAVLRYREGHLIGSEWRGFAAPDGTWSADLLGRPREEQPGSGERWYTARGWYSGVSTWVGWRELDPLQRQLAKAKDGFVGLEKLFKAEADRLREKFGGSVVRNATKFDGPLLTRELRLATPDGPVVGRILLQPDGPNPRAYFVGMAGRFDPDGPDAARFFNSFRVTE